MKPKFFRNAKQFRSWLDKNHDKANELWLGYYKKDSGKANYTWSETVDEALCFGWIDGIRKSIDDVSYMIRFTPRNLGSNWSAVNISKVNELTRRGLMKKAGIEAFKKRRPENSGVYSFEQDKIKLDKSYESKIKKNKKAWSFFQSLPPSAKKPSIWWIMSAKKEETRIRRLDILIQSSEKGEKIPQLDISRKK
jgi:uncharacterized protein YdeI (YjbR/CyaY-like superfamily)